MQSRIPRDFDPPATPGYLWAAVSGGGGEPNVPQAEVILAQAFESNGNSGMQIRIGTDVTNDPVWEENGAGGIQLRL